MTEKTTTKMCAMCNNPFTIVTARKDGKYMVTVQGARFRRYCDHCIPRALYKDHAAYQRWWWHNMRKVADEAEG